MSSSPQVVAQHKPPWPEITELIGGDHLRAATSLDAVDGVIPQMVAEPAGPDELARTLRAANAAGAAVIPRGGGTKLGWGNPPRRADLVLSTARMNSVLEHAWADMTASVEAGCTVAALQQRLAAHGQHLAIDPLWPELATIGGILAANDSGALRVRYGSLRDLIIGITVALPDGTLAKSGGKVVKNVAGYDLPKLITGSLGTLGVITQAIFRLHPQPKTERTITFEAGSAEALNEFLLAFLDSQLPFTGLQMRVGEGRTPELDIRFAGTPAGIEAQVNQARKLAIGARETESPSAPWKAQQRLWDLPGQALLAKISVLPADLHALCALTRTAAQARGIDWSLVVQGVGVGWLRLSGTDTALIEVARFVRGEIANKLGGSFVAYGCKALPKSQVDVWGVPGDEMPLMRRVKEQFDPAGTLNPGRFVGGI